MSYAVETKKRKFHRLLESLTKPSDPHPSTTTSNSSPSRDPDLLSIKKVRLTRQENDNLTPARNSILKVARPSSRTSSVSSTSRPSFVPWDRERFLERLLTFRRVDRWSPKPAPINEVEWAKRGWVCSDVARVSCVGGCGGSVVVKVPDELDELDGYDAEKVQERKDTRDQLVEKYVGLIIQGHGEGCPWRNKGCDATIHHLPLANPETAISGLQARYSKLAKMADQLPSPEIIQLPESFNLEEMINLLPPTFDGAQPAVPTTETTEAPSTPQTPTPANNDTDSSHPPPANDSDNALPSNDADNTSHPNPPPPVNKAAFMLSFFGWDTTADNAAGLTVCGACFRRLGLWMYRPKENGQPAMYDTLEVTTEHMDYCPWVSGKAQSGTGRASEKPEDLQSGWQVLAQALQVQHRRRVKSTSSAAGSRAVSEAGFAEGPVVDENDEAREKRRASEREWWAKIRRMRAVLNVKTPRKASSG